jgi:hypothetical protein
MYGIHDYFVGYESVNDGEYNVGHWNVSHHHAGFQMLPNVLMGAKKHQHHQATKQWD